MLIHVIPPHFERVGKEGSGCLHHVSRNIKRSFHNSSEIENINEIEITVHLEKE